MAFNVGDLIIGKEHNGYTITNHERVMLVTKTEYDGMTVEVIAGKKAESAGAFVGTFVGTTHYVSNSENKFMLYNPAMQAGYECWSDFFPYGSGSDGVVRSNAFEFINETRNENGLAPFNFIDLDTGEVVHVGKKDIPSPVWVPDLERHIEIENEVSNSSIEIRDLLSTYGYDSTDSARCKIVNMSLENKTGIENLFAKSELYNPQTRQIVFDYKFDRGFAKEEVDQFVDSLRYWMNDYIVAHEYLVDGINCRGYVDLIENYDNLKQVVRRASQTIRSEVDAPSDWYQVDKDTTESFVEASEVLYGRLCEEYDRALTIKTQIQDECFKTSDYYDNCHYLPEEYRNKVRGFKNFIAFLQMLDTNKLDNEEVETLNSIYLRMTSKNLNADTNSKFSRIVQKMCAAMGITTDPAFEWDKKFAKLSDAINPKKIPYKCVLSINQIDFYTMSFGVNYSSCHTIDKTNIRKIDSQNNYHGCNSSGTESYMGDGTSFVFYTVNPKTESEYEKQGKIHRCMFHIGEDKLVQGRLYPQTNDTNGAYLYKQVREAVQGILAPLINPEMTWENESGTYACTSVIETRGTHYADYAHFTQCNVSYMMSPTSNKRNNKPIVVGHNPICPYCGCEHEVEGNILCNDCVADHYDYYYDDEE